MHGQSRMTFGEQQAEVKHRSPESKVLYKLPFGYGELKGLAVLKKKTNPKQNPNTDLAERNIFIK